MDFFGSDLGFVSRITTRPGFVNQVQSGPGFVNPVRSDPIRSNPGFVNAPKKPGLNRVKIPKLKTCSQECSFCNSINVEVHWMTLDMIKDFKYCLKG